MAAHPALTSHLINHILQYFNSLNMNESARTLERESGLFFNVKYFEELFLQGEFEEAELYLEGFTSIHHNIHSARLFFEICKHNFLEALDEGNKQEAVRIMTEDLSFFEQYGSEILSEATQLLNLDNIRMHPMMARYGDTASERKAMVGEIRRIMEGNPALRGKLVCPHMAVISLSSGGSGSGGGATSEINNFRMFDGVRGGSSSSINLNETAQPEDGGNKAE